MPETPVIPDSEQARPKPTLKERIKSPVSKTISRFRRGDQSPHETLQNFVKDEDSNDVAERQSEDLLTMLGQPDLTPQERYAKAVEFIEAQDAPDSDYLTIKNIVDSNPSSNQQKSRERVFTSADRIRHKALEAYAVTKGIRNVSEFNALVRQFEGSMATYEYKRLDFDHVLTPEEQQKVKDEWKEKGYSINDYDFRPSYDQDGKVKYTASFTKRVPLNVQRSDIGIVKQLLDSGENPARALSALDKVGIKVSSLKLDNEALERLKALIKASSSSESVRFLKEFANLPISRDMNIGIHGSTYDADNLLKVLQDGAEKFTPEFMEKVRVISSFARTPVSPSLLNQYYELFNSGEKFTFLTTGLARGYLDSGRFQLNEVLGLDLATIKKLNILMKSNVQIGREYGHYKNILSIPSRMLQRWVDGQEVKTIIEDASKQQFLEILGEVSKTKIEPSWAESMFGDEELHVTAYTVLVNNGIIDASSPRFGEGDRALRTTVNMLRNERVRQAIEDPDFPKFLQQLKDNGVQIKPIDHIYAHNYDIFEVYRYRELIKLKGENILDYARLAAEGDVTDPDVRNKLNEYGLLWANLPLIKELQALGIGNDKVLDPNWIKEVINMPLMRNDLTLPPSGDPRRESWIKDVAVIPHQVQQSLLLKYDSLLRTKEDPTVKQQLQEGVHKIASLIKENEWMQDSKMAPLVIYVVDISDVSTTAERLEFANKLVAMAGENSTSVLREYEEFNRSNPDNPVDDSFVLQYAQKFNNPEASKDLAIKRGNKIFGDFLSIDSYILTKGIVDGSVDPNIMKEFGITKTGAEGLVQLEGVMRNFVFSLTSNEVNTTLLRNKSFADFFKAYTRYTGSSWGRHDSESFLRTILTYEQIKEAQPNVLKTDLPSSGIVEVAKVERPKENDQTFTETFLSRYGTLTRNIQTALDISSQPRAFSTMAKLIDEKRQEVISSLVVDLEKNENPKAKQHIQQRIDKLNGVNPSDVKSFQSNFAELAQEKAFSDLLMQSVFLYTLKKYPEQVERMMAALSEGPSIDSISTVLDFTEHMTTKEAWKDYFTDKKAKKGFQNILDTKEINEGLNRLQNSGNRRSGVSAIEFVPTRGLLMEFSGHMADACWASKYESTAAQFPNMTAVVMQDVSKEIPKPLGSTILIETAAPDGTELLIIRGLNPIESYINHVDIADFYEKYISYVKKIAAEKGRKAAIVIDGISGGAATNRPSLYNFLESQKPGLTQIPVSTTDTTFNNYDISKHTYLL